MHNEGQHPEYRRQLYLVHYHALVGDGCITHLLRVETGGVSMVATNIPPFSVFANKNGEIFFGKQINYEDGEPSYNYYFSNVIRQGSPASIGGR